MSNEDRDVRIKMILCGLRQRCFKNMSQASRLMQLLWVKSVDGEWYVEMH